MMPIATVICPTRLACWFASARLSFSTSISSSSAAMMADSPENWKSVPSISRLYTFLQSMAAIMAVVCGTVKLTRRERWHLDRLWRKADRRARRADRSTNVVEESSAP